MKIQHNIKPYSGYIVIPRAMILMFRGKRMNFHLFGAYIALLSEIDWDPRHNTFCCLTKPDDYLSKKWGCGNLTIWRIKKDLVSIGALNQQSNGYFNLSYPVLLSPKYVRLFGKIRFSDVNDFFSKLKESTSQMKEDFSNMKDYQLRNPIQSFNVSSKGNVSVVSSDNSIGLSEEDKKLINEILQKGGNE